MSKRSVGAVVLALFCPGSALAQQMDSVQPAAGTTPYIISEPKVDQPPTTIFCGPDPTGSSTFYGYAGPGNGFGAAGAGALGHYWSSGGLEPLLNPGLWSHGGVGSSAFATGPYGVGLGRGEAGIGGGAWSLPSLGYPGFAAWPGPGSWGLSRSGFVGWGAAPGAFACGGLRAFAPRSFGYGGFAGGYPAFGSIGGYGGYRYGSYLPFAGYGGGFGGIGYGGGSRLGTLSPTRTIQTAPSKPSGNYYAPSSIDPTASGSYYAQSGSAAYPVSRSSGSPPKDYWGEMGNPFGKDLMSTPWSK